MSVEVGSPVPGLVAPLSEVPDPVFSQSMVGPGVTVKPQNESGDAVAPIAGRITTLHPHAFVVVAPHGTAILVHLGIDTVKLKGEGFTVHVTKGAEVQAGQKIVSWNPAEVEELGYSSMCPVVVPDVGAELLGELREDGAVVAGEALFTVDV